MARLIALWWIPLAVALAAVVGWETDWGTSIQRPLVVPPAPSPKVAPLTLLPEYKQVAGPEAYAEVIDRPLFSPTRRQAPPPPPPEQPKQQMQTGLFQLTGTIQVGDKLYAFLKETKSGKGVRVAQGDSLSSGAKLAKVEPDRVVLTQYDSEEEVKMQVAKSTRATPVAPPPTAAIPGQPAQPVQAGQPGAVPQPGPNGEPATGRPLGPPIVPGSPNLAPFVPGVANPQTRPDGTTELPPRRRGAMQ